MRLESIQRTIERKRADLLKLMSDLEAAEKKTAQFLQHCKDCGIKKVAVCASHESVKSSVGFAFGPRGSAFADEKEEGGTWPAIWKACDRAGVSGGCGNSGQRQLILNHGLVEGVFHLKGGHWKLMPEGCE